MDVDIDEADSAIQMLLNKSRCLFVCSGICTMRSLDGQIKRIYARSRAGLLWRSLLVDGWCNEEGRNRRRGGKAGRNNPQKDAAVCARFVRGLLDRQDLRLLEVVTRDVVCLFVCC